MSNIDYSKLTVAELKAEIMLRTNGDVQPFNTKTRKPELIDWLVAYDNVTAELAKLGEAISNGDVIHVQAKITLPMSYGRKVGIYTRNGTRKLTVAQKRQLRKTNKRAMHKLGIFDVDWSR